jgi:ABC-type multidrug transport system fused ATPase/permease subunit
MVLIDEPLQLFLSESITNTLQILSMIIVVIIVQPFNLVPISIILVYLVLLKVYVGSSTREIRRLDQVSRSPVLSQLSSTIAGLPVVRCFKWQAFLRAKFHELVNFGGKASFSYIALLVFYQTYVDLGSVFMISCNALILVLMRDSAETASVSLSYT